MSDMSRLHDPELELLHNFYEPLTVLEILGPLIGPRSQGSLRTSTSDEVSYTALRSFLDRLSWICDYKSGGETIVAISLEQTLHGTKFWMAANFKAVQKTEAHLEHILRSLQGTHDLSAQDLHKLEQDICNSCMTFASDRVNHYIRAFHRLLEEHNRTFRQTNLLLSQDLSHLDTLGSVPSELCAAADQFRDSESLKLLSQYVSSTKSPSTWSLLRHYIGRLGSWHRACRTIIQFSCERPDIFANFQLKVLSTPKPITAPRVDKLTHLQGALSRMFAAEEQPGLRQAVEALQRLRHFDLDSTFREKYRDKNFKPRVHVEAWLLEHFYNNEMISVDDDKYIGCSKPSCYCCNLYFLQHPGGFVQRPTHGNVWPHWQSPLHQDKERQAHDASMKQSMINKFREDLKDQLSRPTAKLRPAPDTTTGFTLSNT